MQVERLLLRLLLFRRILVQIRVGIVGMVLGAATATLGRTADIADRLALAAHCHLLALLSLCPFCFLFFFLLLSLLLPLPHLDPHLHQPEHPLAEQLVAESALSLLELRLE